MKPVQSGSMTPTKPFTTDGCSAGMTWAWRTFARKDPPWEGACVEHDRAYWQGGTRFERFSADTRLCVTVASFGHLGWAVTMFLVVRLGGHPLLPFPWRWGYGYPWPRRYIKCDPADSLSAVDRFFGQGWRAVPRPRQGAARGRSHRAPDGASALKSETRKTS